LIDQTACEKLVKLGFRLAGQRSQIVRLNEAHVSG
jgi:hypothetical protein